MVLDAALGSGVNEPLIDVGEACTMVGAAGVTSCVDAAAMPGATTITPITNAAAVESRRRGARRPRLTTTSPTRMCPHVLDTCKPVYTQFSSIAKPPSPNDGRTTSRI